MTFTVTGTPSFIRSRGPGEMPLYPMVLMIRFGAQFHRDRRDFEREIGLRDVVGSGRRQKRLRLHLHLLLGKQPSACRRQANCFEKIASLHKKR